MVMLLIAILKITRWFLHSTLYLFVLWFTMYHQSHNSEKTQVLSSPWASPCLVDCHWCPVVVSKILIYLSIHYKMFTIPNEIKHPHWLSHSCLRTSLLRGMCYSINLFLPIFYFGIMQEKCWAWELTLLGENWIMGLLHL